jgi:hypothetical protein
MSNFAKQAFCPSSATISAYTAGKLSFLLHRSVADHLAKCEFCSVESNLWRSFPAAAAASAHDSAAGAGAPPLPLAWAENLFDEMHTEARPAVGSHAA